MLLQVLYCTVLDVVFVSMVLGCDNEEKGAVVFFPFKISGMLIADMNYFNMLAFCNILRCSINAEKQK